MGLYETNSEDIMIWDGFRKLTPEEKNAEKTEAEKANLLAKQWGWLGLKNPANINIVSLQIINEKVYLNYQDMTELAKNVKFVIVDEDHVPFGLTNDGTNEYVVEPKNSKIEFREPVAGVERQEFAGIRDKDSDWRITLTEWGQVIKAGSLGVNVQGDSDSNQTCYKNRSGRWIVKKAKSGFVRLITVGDEYKVVRSEGARVIAEGANRRQTRRYLIIEFKDEKSWLYIDADDCCGKKVIRQDGIYTPSERCYCKATDDGFNTVFDYLDGKVAPDPELLLKKAETKAFVLVGEPYSKDFVLINDSESCTALVAVGCTALAVIKNEDDNLTVSTADQVTINEGVKSAKEEKTMTKKKAREIRQLTHPLVESPRKLYRELGTIPSDGGKVTVSKTESRKIAAQLRAVSEIETAAAIAADAENYSLWVEITEALFSEREIEPNTTARWISWTKREEARRDREALRQRRRKAKIAKMPTPSADDWYYSEGEDCGSDDTADNSSLIVSYQIRRCLKFILMRAWERDIKRGVNPFKSRKSRKPNPQRYHLRKYKRHLNREAIANVLKEEAKAKDALLIHQAQRDYAMARMAEYEEACSNYISSAVHFKSGGFNFDVQRFAQHDPKIAIKSLWDIIAINKKLARLNARIEKHVAITGESIEHNKVFGDYWTTLKGKFFSRLKFTGIEESVDDAGYTVKVNGETWDQESNRKHRLCSVIFTVKCSGGEFKGATLETSLETEEQLEERIKAWKLAQLEELKKPGFVDKQRVRNAQISARDRGYSLTIDSVEQFNAHVSETCKVQSESVTVRLMSVLSDGTSVVLCVEKNANAITGAVKDYAYKKEVVSENSFLPTERFVDSILIIECENSQTFSFLVDPITRDAKRIYLINDKLFWHDPERGQFTGVERGEIYSDEILDEIDEYTVFGAKWSVASAGNQKNKTIEYYGTYYSTDPVKTLKRRVPWDSIFSKLRLNQEETLQNRYLDGYSFETKDICTEGVRLANAEAPYRQFDEEFKDLWINLKKDNCDGTNYINADFASLVFSTAWATVSSEICEGNQEQGRGILQEKVTFLTLANEILRELCKHRASMEKFQWNDPHVKIINLSDENLSKADLDLLERLQSVQVKPFKKGSKTVSLEEMTDRLMRRKHLHAINLAKKFDLSDIEKELKVQEDYQEDAQIARERAEKILARGNQYENILEQIHEAWGENITAIRVVREITPEMESGDKAPDVIVDPNGFKTGTRIEKNDSKTAGLRFLGVVNQHDTLQRTSSQLNRSVYATLPIDVSLEWCADSFREYVDSLINREIGKSPENLRQKDLRYSTEITTDEDTGEIVSKTKMTPKFDELSYKIKPSVLKHLPRELADAYDGTLKSLFSMANRSNYPIKGIHGQLTPDLCYAITGIHLLGFVTKEINGHKIQMMEVYVPRLDGDDNEYGNVTLDEIRTRVDELVKREDITAETGELVKRAYECLHPGLIVISTKDEVLRTIEGADFDGDSGYLLIIDVNGHKLQIFIRYPKTHLQGYAIVSCDEFWASNKYLKTICVNIEFNSNALEGRAEEQKIDVGNVYGCLAETVASSIARVWNEMSCQLKRAVEMGKNPALFFNLSPDEFGLWGSLLYQLQIPRSVGEVINEFSPLVDLLIWHRVLDNDKIFKENFTVTEAGKKEVSLAKAWEKLQRETAKCCPILRKGQKAKKFSAIRHEAEENLVGEYFGSKMSIVALENIMATVRTVLNVKPYVKSSAIANIINGRDSLASFSNESLFPEKSPTHDQTVSTAKAGIRYKKPFMTENFDEKANISKVTVTYENARKAMEHAARFTMPIEEYAVDHGIMVRNGDGYDIVKGREEDFVTLKKRVKNGYFWTPGLDNRIFLSDIGNVAWDFNGIIRFYGEGTIDQVKKPVAEMIRELLNELCLKHAKPLSKHTTFGHRINFNEEGKCEVEFGAVRDNGGIIERYGATFEDAINATSTIERKAAYLQDACYVQTQKCINEVIRPFADYAEIQVDNALDLPKEELDKIVELAIGPDGKVSELMAGYVGNTFNVLAMMWRTVNTFIRLKREELAKSGIVRGSALYDAVNQTMKAQKKIVFNAILNTANSAFDRLAEYDSEGIFKDPATRARIIYIASALGSDLYKKLDEEIVREKLSRTSNKMMKQFAGSSYMSWIIEIAKKVEGKSFEDPKTFDRVYLTGFKGFEKELDGAEVLVEKGEIRIGKFSIGYLHDTEVNGVFTLRTVQEEDKNGELTDHVYVEESIVKQLAEIAKGEKGDPSKVAIQLHEYINVDDEQIYTNPEKVFKQIKNRKVYLAFGGLNKRVRGFVPDQVHKKHGRQVRQDEIYTQCENIDYTKGFGLYVIVDEKPVWLGAIQGTTTKPKDFSPALCKVYGAENVVMKATVAIGIKTMREGIKAETAVDEDGIEVTYSEKILRESVVLALENLEPASDEECRIFDSEFKREEMIDIRLYDRYMEIAAKNSDENLAIRWLTSLRAEKKAGKEHEILVSKHGGNCIFGNFEGFELGVKYEPDKTIVVKVKEKGEWKGILKRDSMEKVWNMIS